MNLLRVFATARRDGNSVGFGETGFNYAGIQDYFSPDGFRLAAWNGPW
jgi:hypothetical protein